MRNFYKKTTKKIFLYLDVGNKLNKFLTFGVFLNLFCCFYKILCTFSSFNPHFLQSFFFFLFFTVLCLLFLKKKGVSFQKKALKKIEFLYLFFVEVECFFFKSRKKCFFLSFSLLFFVLFLMFFSKDYNIVFVLTRFFFISYVVFRTTFDFGSVKELNLFKDKTRLFCALESKTIASNRKIFVLTFICYFLLTNKIYNLC